MNDVCGKRVNCDYDLFCKQFEKSVYQSWNEASFSNFCEGKHGAGVRNFVSNLSILPQNIILMRVKQNPFYPKLELFYSDWSGVERGGGA